MIVMFFQSNPPPASFAAPPQAAWAGEDDEDASPVQLRRRGPVEDGELNGGCGLRGAPAKGGGTKRPQTFRVTIR